MVAADAAEADRPAKHATMAEVLSHPITRSSRFYCRTGCAARGAGLGSLVESLESG